MSPSSSPSSNNSWSARFTAAAQSAWTRLRGGPAPIRPANTASSGADGSLPEDEAQAQVRGGLSASVRQAVRVITVETLPPPPTPTEVSAQLFANRAAWDTVDRKHTPPDPAPDVEASPEPEHLTVHISQGRSSAPARETLADVRFHPLPRSVRERCEEKRQQFEARAGRDQLQGQQPLFMPVTPSQSARDASSWGRRLALRDLVSQAAGRFTGQAVAAHMLVSTWDSERETYDDGGQRRMIFSGACIILTMGVVFGLRAGYLMARAWRGPDHHPGTAAMLGMGPTVAQLMMVMMALQYGGVPVGTTVTLNIVNRLVAAAVRDIVAQSQGKLWGKLVPVDQDGLGLALTRSRAAFDRDRLQGARDTYLSSSLVLLWMFRWVLEWQMDEWINQVDSHTMAGRMRAGLPGIAMSVLNEAFDAWQGSQWQYHSAQKNQLGLRFTSGYCCGSGRCNCSAKALLEVGELAVSNVGMRQAFGTLTSDIWTTWSEFYPDHPAKVFLLRAVAAAFNSLTTYRGYTVERGRSMSPPELQTAIDGARRRLAEKRQLLETVSIRRAYPALHEAACADLSRLFREFMIEQGIGPDQQAELNQVLQSDRVRRWIGAVAAETVRQNKLAELAMRWQRPFEVVSSGDQMFREEEVEGAGDSPTPDLPRQTPPPSLSPSAVPSAANSPNMAVRHVSIQSPDVPARAREQPTAAQVSLLLSHINGRTAPEFLETLTHGTPVFVDHVPVTFAGWRSDGMERKGPERQLMEVMSDEPVEMTGWQEVAAPGPQHVYRLAPSLFLIRPRTAPPAQDHGEGVGFPR